jgi:hypothetical protein
MENVLQLKIGSSIMVEVELVSLVGMDHVMPWRVNDLGLYRLR